MVAASLVLVGCDGTDGAAGTSTATLSGSVTNTMSGGPVPGAVVTTDPAVPGVSITADAAGDYSVELPIGNYTLSCTDANFQPGSGSVSLVAGVAATADFGLTPTAPVIISITGLPASVGPSSTFGLTASVTVMDGSTGPTYLWTQTASAAATIVNPTSATATITLGDEAAYIAELRSHVEGAGHYWGPMGISPFSLEEAALVTFQVAVTTSSGTHTETIDVHADLDFATVSGGLRNVPVGVPVLLNNKDQAAYDWTFATRPAGSTAPLNGAATANAWFEPDLAGLYEVTVTDAVDGPITLQIYAGSWEGVIVGQDGNGRPTAQSICVGCHNGIAAPDKFTPWAQTGHAEILGATPSTAFPEPTANLNTSTHYGTGCFPCHTVGFDTAAPNGGFDEASDYSAFLAGGLINNPSDTNWTTMLASFPDSAQLANIQCENCHGPQNGPGGGPHMMGNGSRTSLSADVCGACHGEPKRHGRFQQWELSGHSNYELAIDESWSTSDLEFRSCGMCHSANGFIDWVNNGGADPDYDPPADLVSSPDEIHAQTCVTCHDPHDVGTSSGEGTDAPMRIEGDTEELQAGFTAFAVGKGAVCMTCHNSRRGLANDLVGLPNASRPDYAPHGPTHADVLMGQNVFFFPVGVRGAHSLIEDTCVKCHLDLTDPPADLSYNLGGTNHTFAASDDICSNCHGSFTADSVIDSTEAQMAALDDALTMALYLEIDMRLRQGNTVTVDGTNATDTGDVLVIITDIADVTDIDLAEYHGRQAMNITVAGVTVYNVRLDADTEVTDPTPTVIGSLIDSANGQIIIRAGWNYYIVHNDGSHGVHNPSFTNEALVRAIAQLAALDFTVPPPPP
ncbi:MAG: carboxypeptidase-like regulatory domain-containing protein [Planctomycetota bacterium]